ncbi:DUF1150 family protein [Brevundimonas sp. 2R-24]|uniref:DUF1150 family protein n=1 Tax=Peiella sedimenti TaxID=3061083 RepID=A0ABT8SIR2_9CAUL|nr:DUF1150 family protein [Caulobacteraceae bacterium XZ-24]
MQLSPTKEALRRMGAPDLVYVREIKAREIMADSTPQEVKGFQLHPNQTLYAVHSADGARLAVLVDRDAAFAAAVAHELEPVSVH